MKDSWMKRKLVSIYEMLYEWNRVISLHTKYRLKIMTYKQTLRYVENTGCSIARFGDGEFSFFCGSSDIGFQANSKELTDALLSVLQSKTPNLLICVPHYFTSLVGCNERAKKYWTEWGKIDNKQRKVSELLRCNCGYKYRFGDAHLTRPYIDQISRKRAEYTYCRLKKLWKDKDVLVIEGTQTRLGVGNDLLSSARTVKRILAPAKNAFSRYEEIYSVILRNYTNQLVLLALGPTATVLAANLADKNIQALDIGHIDIEYEWYLSGAREKEAVPGKFVQEVRDGDHVDLCEDDAYTKQIIAIIQ